MTSTRPPSAEGVVNPSDTGGVAGGLAHGVALGRLCVVLAAVMWSSSGLFAKAPLFESWPPEMRGPLLAFWRALFAGLLLLPAVRAPRYSLKLVPLCLFFVVMNITYLTAMTLTTAANSIWLQSTAPWWVFLAGVVFLQEPFSPAERVPLVVGGVGLGIILWFEVQGQDRTGVLFGLLSGMSYAGVVMSLRSLRNLETVWIVAVAHLVTAAAILPYVVYLNLWPNAAQLVVLAAFGMFQMGLPYVLFARGLRSITAQEATGIGLLEPMLLPIWVALVWDEFPAPSTLIGGGLILVGLALRYAIPLLRRHETSTAA